MSETISEDLDAFTVVDETNEEEEEEEELEVNSSEQGETEETGATIEDEEDNEHVAKEEENNSARDKFVLESITPEADHPYVDLIESFEYPEEQVTITPLEPVRPVSETPLQVIDSKTSLIKLLQTLRNVKEIAIDLRPSMKGFVRQVHVMALSTREADYIIDVAQLKNELTLLTEIFINPKIVKIYFSKISDPTMACLQHKLCLYVVNLFDLKKAAAALYGKNLSSFRVILKRDYSVNADVLKYRSGILKKEGLESCRIKSHFLIHMYHDYKNKLLTKDEQLYKEVLQQCRDASKDLHCDRLQEELAHLEQTMQNRHNAELELLKKLFAWRATTAKEMNKSPNEIMDKLDLLKFASHLPRDLGSVIYLTKSKDVRRANAEIINIVKEIYAEYNPEYATLALKPRESHYEEFKRKLLQGNNRPNKRAKFDKGPNTFNQAKRQRTSKNERYALRPNKSSQRGFSNLNIPPFLSQSTGPSTMPTNSNFLPVMGSTSFQQTNSYNPPFQARFQNNSGDYNNGSNIMGNSGIDYDYDSSSNYNQESSHDYDFFNNRGREVNTGQKWNTSHFQEGNNDGW